MKWFDSITDSVNMKVKVKVTQLCLNVYNCMDCTLPGSSVPGILQARILEWVAIPFSSGSSWPRDRTRVSSIAGGFFTSWATREAHIMSGTWQKFNRQLILPFVIIPAVSTVPQLWEAREWSGNEGGLLRWGFQEELDFETCFKRKEAVYWKKRKERPIVEMKVACGRLDVAVVVQSLSHVWLCDPMDCSTPGSFVPHHLPEVAQTLVHWVGDTIQPSHQL